MILQLPNLDDRRWADLVEQGRALIPLFAPEWTDHNVHDPGITTIELLASIAELDLYQLNQISDLQRRKFLALIGVEPRPPRAARGAVAFQLAGPGAMVPLPAGVELIEADPTEPRVRVRTLDAVSILPVTLRAVIADSGAGIADLTPHYAGRGAAGTEPPPPIFRPGGPSSQALYLGFSFDGTPPPPAGARLSLFIAFAGAGTTLDDRQRLLDEQGDERHHAVSTTWEYWDGPRASWDPLQADDDTRAFTLDGRVVLTIPDGLGARTLGPIAEPLLYIRCRVAAGEHDAPPVIRAIAANSVAIEQATPVWQRWTIAAAATITGTPPALGGESGLRLRFGAGGRLDAVTFDEEAPRFTVLEFEKAPNREGRLTIEASGLGRASGTPHLRLSLRDRPIVAPTLRLVSFEDDEPRTWQRRADFFASRRADAHHLLDATRGVVEFGDGERGRVVPSGAPILAAYHATLAEEGNLPASASFVLDDSPRNHALLGDVAAIQARLAAATSPVPAAGGAAAETLAHATGRAIEARESSLRAVTLRDYETLALSTPGTRVARAAARANVRPGFACARAAGHVSIVIVPDSGSSRPVPSQGLLAAVSRYLQRRRVVGTRLEVVAPEYVEIAVRATVAAFPRVDTNDVRTRAVRALDRFLDPLQGGPEGTGWPFGRDVYRTELLEILDGTEGIDHVVSLELIVNGCGGRCGNVCLPANGLVAAGRHEIEVV
jgi:hypothetical protein